MGKKFRTAHVCKEVCVYIVCICVFVNRYNTYKEVLYKYLYISENHVWKDLSTVVSIGLEVGWIPTSKVLGHPIVSACKTYPESTQLSPSSLPASWPKPPPSLPWSTVITSYQAPSFHFPLTSPPTSTCPTSVLSTYSASNPQMAHNDSHLIQSKKPKSFQWPSGP